MKEKLKISDKIDETSTTDGKDSKDGIWKDPRFAHLVSDPRFRNIHKSTKSIKIDKRFKGMFEDDKFKVKYTVDKYGRRVNKTSTEDLEKYYDVDSDDDEEEQRKEEDHLAKEGGDMNERHESDEEIAEDIKTKLKDMSVDYARGEIPLLTDSSSDEETSDDEEDQELFIEHAWGELGRDRPTTEESTCRLALENMDWDRIRASDLMVLFYSFLPPGGSIVSIKIYQSEYGKERMAEEELNGPQELTKSQPNEELEFDSDDSEANEDNEEGDEYHMEKLRQYQLNRLRYYFAVIECNSVATADKLYTECDGLEYESTATKMDLSYVPDEFTFDNALKDECNEMPDLNKYKPRLFTTTALQQAKVELTWDENDVDRAELNEKVNTGKLNDIPDSELRKFVAYSSEEEEEHASDKEATVQSEEEIEPDDEPANAPSKKSTKKHDTISKYKNLLNEINKKEQEKKKNKVEMEFSWGIDVSSNEEKSMKQSNDAELTPFEKIIEKKREKKRARKQKIRELKKGQDESDNHSGSEDDLPDGIDLNDPYFAEEFANGEFAPVKSKKKKSTKKQPKEEDNESEAQRDLELLLDDDDHKAHFSLKKIQEQENETKTSKKRRKKLKNRKDVGEKQVIEDNFKIDVADNRFSAIYSSHLFNIDPTDSHYRKTKGMETLIQEKLKRKTSDTNGKSSSESGEPVEKKRKDIANSILIKSIKRKVQQQK